MPENKDRKLQLIEAALMLKKFFSQKSEDTELSITDQVYYAALESDCDAMVDAINEGML